ncbi:hypothetical protein, partial [Bacteroides thetaiotaomicron]|uniref:hypothetical protein n=1 Tax=Bacteroides thetaiotaomicron TaxID=818 RepID=UPI001E61147B
AFGEQKEGVMNRLAFDVGTDAAPDFTHGNCCCTFLFVQENGSPVSGLLHCYSTSVGSSRW